MSENSSNFRVAKFLDLASYFLILLNVFLVPLFLNKQVSNIFIVSKNYLFFGLVLVNLLFWAIRIIISKRILYRKSFLDWSLLSLFVISFFSAIFSVNVFDSFLGRTDYFTLNFISILFFIVFYLVLVNQLNTEKRWQGVVSVLLVAGGISAISFLLKTIFNISLPGWENIFNSVSSFNSIFGIWIVFQLILASSFLIQKEISLKWTIFNLVLVILHFVVLLVLGFEILWWLLLIGFILILLLGVILINQIRLSWFSVIFIGLILSVIFIVFGSPKSIQATLPAEISLSSAVSWNIANETIFHNTKNFFLGSGLGTFVVDFSRFKPLDLNYNLMAWSLRFNEPGNIFFTWLSEGGVLTFLTFVFILLFVLGFSIHTFYYLRQQGKLNLSASESNKKVNIIPVFAILIGWLILWVSGAFSSFGPVLWWLWWLCLGLIVTGLFNLMKSEQIIKEKNLVFEETPQHSLVFSFSIILVMAATVMIGVFGIRFYLAEYYYTKALVSQDLDQSQVYLTKAVEARKYSDVYNASLARVYLLKAVRESQVAESNPEVIMNFVAQAVNQAKLATEISPQSVAIWENLAIMYNNAAPLVPDANDWAIKSFSKAIELEPTNPVLRWLLGNTYFGMQDWDKAIENFEKAIELKRDYVSAYMSLAKVYENKANFNKAIEYYSIILPVSRNNPEVLFNLGRLYYNRKEKGDWDKAEQFLLEAVKIQPNFAGAWYSLGILSENRGNKSQAVQYYYKVKSLGISDQTLENKIKNLSIVTPPATEE